MQMTRNDFIGRTALFGAAVAAGRVFADGQALLGLGDAAHENAAVRATARKNIADGLYAGLACASNRGDLYLERSRRFTGPAIAVDPVRDFAGVVLGNRKASKEKTMGPRMHLLDLMAAGAPRA